MPGWHWCRDKDGAHSWVPEEYLIIQGDRGALTHDYNTLELTVEQGDELEYVTEVKYWTLLRAGDGAVGWVPTDKLKTQ